MGNSAINLNDQPFCSEVSLNYLHQLFPSHTQQPCLLGNCPTSPFQLVLIVLESFHP